MALMSFGYASSLALCICMIYYGSTAVNKCPAGPTVPIYLVGEYSCNLVHIYHDHVSELCENEMFLATPLFLPENWPEMPLGKITFTIE